VLAAVGGFPLKAFIKLQLYGIHSFESAEVDDVTEHRYSPLQATGGSFGSGENGLSGPKGGAPGGSSKGSGVRIGGFTLNGFDGGSGVKGFEGGSGLKGS